MLVRNRAYKSYWVTIVMQMISAAGGGVPPTNDQIKSIGVPHLMRPFAHTNRETFVYITIINLFAYLLFIHFDCVSTCHNSLPQLSTEENWSRIELDRVTVNYQITCRKMSNEKKYHYCWFHLSPYFIWTRLANVVRFPSNCFRFFLFLFFF